MINHLTSGQLIITVCEAELTRDTEAIGSMDPYVKAKWEREGEDKDWKSSMLEGAGKTPNWLLNSDDHTFEVIVHDMHESIKFIVKDQNVIDTEEIGEFQIEYSALCFNEGIDEWFTLFHDNASAGKLRLKTRFRDNAITSGETYEEYSSKMEKELYQLKQAQHNEFDVEDLIPFNLEEAVQNGEVTVTGTEHYGDECPTEALMKSQEPHSKFIGPLGDCFKLALHFKTKITMRGYGVRSANDCPERDPKSWSVFGENDFEEGCEAKLLHQVDEADNWEGERWTIRKYKFNQVITTDFIEFKVHENNNDENVQIGQFVLYH